MIESYKAKNFIIQELVPELVYDARGEKAWQLIDVRLWQNLDSMKEQLEALYGRKVPVTVNNWLWEGGRDESGLRIPGQKYYKRWSQHSFGRGADPVCGIPAPDIREHIKQKEIVLPHPACFEEFDGMSWVHMDVRDMSNGHTYFFKV